MKNIHLYVLAWLWQVFNVKNEVTALETVWGTCLDSFWKVKKWHIMEKDVGRFLNFKNNINNILLRFSSITYNKTFH